MIMLTKKELFKKRCYDPLYERVFFKELSDKFWESWAVKTYLEMTRYTLPSTTCRYCKTEILEKDFCVTTTPRRSMLAPSHKDCESIWNKNEAYECQKIDESCNDCIFFQRWKIKHDIRWHEWKCLKLNTDTYSYQWISLWNKCKWKHFKHRKD